MFTFRPSPAGQHPHGQLEFHDTTITYDQGTLRAKHPTTGRTSDVVPE